MAEIVISFSPLTNKLRLVPHAPSCCPSSTPQCEQALKVGRFLDGTRLQVFQIVHQLVHDNTPLVRYSTPHDSDLVGDDRPANDAWSCPVKVQSLTPSHRGESRSGPASST